MAGATRARISAHFASEGHIADVTAKESTQETALTLIGLGVGLICANYVGDNPRIAWFLFFLLTAIHQYANYRLVRVLVLDTLNPQRLYLIARYIDVDLKASIRDFQRSPAGVNNSRVFLSLPTPEYISLAESIYRPIWLAVYGPQLGCSVSLHLACLTKIAEIVNIDRSHPHKSISFLWTKLKSAWRTEKFIISVDLMGRPSIVLLDSCNEDDCIKAFLVACYLQYRWPEQLASSRTLFGQQVSEETLLSRYNYIVNEGASNGLKWHHEHISRPNLSEFGWDLAKGKSRLGEESWRLIEKQRN